MPRALISTVAVVVLTVAAFMAGMYATGFARGEKGGLTRLIGMGLMVLAMLLILIPAIWKIE
jgi:hypothetical protein